MAEEPETTDTGEQVGEPTAADVEGRDQQHEVDEAKAGETDAADLATEGESEGRFAGLRHRSAVGGFRMSDRRWWPAP